MQHQQRLTFTSSADGWMIDGELDHLNRTELLVWCEGLAKVQEARTLEFAGLDILDAEGVVAAVEAIRLLLQRTPALTISHAPHLLSHTLYRIGMLEAGGRLTLVEPRQEEPYG